MPHGPQWHSNKIALSEVPNKLHKVFWRDPLECAAFLAGNPTFSDDMEFMPKEVFEADGVTRIYHEMMSGEVWKFLYKTRKMTHIIPSRTRTKSQLEHLS